MDVSRFVELLEKAAENPQLARELLELAAKYGVDLQGEVSDTDLEAVAGGGGTNPDRSAGTYFENFDVKTTQYFNTLSSVLRTMRTSSGAVVRNLS